MGYAAPNPAAQADVIAEAHAVAGIDASTRELCRDTRNRHPLGDPIEVQGLRNAFAVSSNTQTRARASSVSVKSNIGHLEVAAGVVGLIKTILCLKNKAIPATLHFTSPNPELRLDETPFTVQSRYTAHGNGTECAGPGSAHSGWAGPTCTSSSKRRRRLPAHAEPARPPGAAAVGENHVGT